MALSTAKAIGEWYAESRTALKLSVQRQWLCGQELALIKESLPHGEWELWLKDHQSELGFGSRTAQKLMRLAKAPLTADLTDEQAAQMSRQVWGNEPELIPTAPDPFSSHYRRIEGFVEWAAKHPVADLPESELIELRPRIEALRLWIAELDGKAKRLNLRIAS